MAGGGADEGGLAVAGGGALGWLAQPEKSGTTIITSAIHIMQATISNPFFFI